MLQKATRGKLNTINSSRTNRERLGHAIQGQAGPKKIVELFSLLPGSGIYIVTSVPMGELDLVGKKKGNAIKWQMSRIFPHLTGAIRGWIRTGVRLSV